MKKSLIIMSMASALLAACNGGAEKVQSNAEAVQPAQENTKVIHRLPRLHVLDTCRVGDNVYTWEIDRVASDSLGIVMDDMGFRYADNSVKLHVYRNGGVLFAKTFRKADFAHMLGQDFLSKSILDGCRFLQVQDGVIFFSLAVSYPESDMSQPFKLSIAMDGNANLLKSNEMDDEYPSDSIVGN